MPLLLCLFLFSAMFLPHYGHARPEYLFLVLLLIGAVRQNTEGGLLFGIRAEVVLLGLMAISALISIVAYNTTKPDSIFHWRDLMSVVRYPASAALLVAVANVRIEGSGRALVMRYIGFAGLLAGVISVLQYFDPFGLNATFLTLYRGDADDVYVRNFVESTGYRRVIGTAGNPNNWGFALSALGLFVMARVVYERRLSWLPHVGLILVSLLMTGSRTALLGFIAGALVVFGVGLRLGRARGPTIAAALLALLTIPLVFAVYTAQVGEEAGSERYSTRRLGSLMNRLDVWSATIEEYSEDLFIGRGPTKAARREGFRDAKTYQVRDNIFVSVFAQFGVLGLTLLLGFFYVQGVKLYRFARFVPPEDLAVCLGALGMFVSWCIYNMAADAFFALHPSYGFLGLYGLTVAWVRPTFRASLPNRSAARMDAGLDPAPPAMILSIPADHRP